MTSSHDTLRILPGPALALALLLLGPPGSRASGPESAGHHCYFYFDPAMAGQVERARTTHRLIRGLPEVEWTAVTPSPARVPGLTTVALQELLSESSRPGPVAGWLRGRAAAGSDHLLIEHEGSVVSSGPGAEARQVIAGAGWPDIAPGASTDVSISTWGKVKDLFQ